MEMGTVKKKECRHQCFVYSQNIILGSSSGKELAVWTTEHVWRLANGFSDDLRKTRISNFVERY